MADGELTLRLSDETLRRLEAEAREAGRTAADVAAELVADALARDADVEEDLRIIAEYERTGESYSVDEAMRHFRRALHAQVRKSA